jgi:hypothetical protein
MGRAIRLIVAGVGLALVATPALASPMDQPSVQALIRDAGRYVKLSITKEAAETKAGNKFIAAVKASCSKSLPNSLASGSESQLRSFAELVEEAGVEFALAEISPADGAASALARELDGLRWSDAKIARTIAASGRYTRAVFALKPPSLCTDIKTSARTNFAVTPRESTKFVRQAMRALEPGGNDPPTLLTILSLLKPDLTRNEPAAIRAIRKRYSSYVAANSKLGARAYARLIDNLVANAGS